jgi:glycosyltransferase involved in cell wall biosynthesis
MKNLIIVNPIQFGYNNATYYYCKYLKDDFEIVYICWDHGLPKIEMDNVKVVYVSRSGNMITRTARFLHAAMTNIKDRQSIVFIKYFKIVSLTLRLLRPKNTFVLDIRTGSVHKKSWVRKISDTRLKLETRFFKHVTVISKSLAEKLGIAGKAHILPLGADVISSNSKTFESLDLIYVGTLFNRNVDITIHGFKKFYDEFKDKISLSYTIVGDGPNNEAQALGGLVSQTGLSDAVKIAGSIPHTELGPFFDQCNIGVSYVPMTDYYDCQPVTKTFEYLLSGMAVIATATSENKLVIDPENGIVVNDSALDFYSGLKTLFENRHRFDSTKIRRQAMGYTWEGIVRNNLYSYLNGIKSKFNV